MLAGASDGEPLKLFHVTPVSASGASAANRQSWSHLTLEANRLRSTPVDPRDVARYNLV